MAGGAWAATARELGLRLYSPVAPFSLEKSFARLLRARGRPLVGVASPKDWMHGIFQPAAPGRRSFEVLVVADATHTRAVVRIDPPLHVGLHWESGTRPWNALVTPRAQAILADEGLAPLLASCREDVAVVDTMVVVFAPGTSESTPAVRGMLLTASDLARAIGSARASTAPDVEHARRAAEWQAAAREAHLSFDEARMGIHGFCNGLEMAITVEGALVRLETTVAVGLPRLAGIDLRLYPHAMRAAIETALLGSSDIRIGRTAFDESFVVRGFPEDRVTVLLEDAHMRQAIAQLATSSTGLRLNDGRLDVTYAAVLDGAGVRAVINAVTALGQRLAAPAAGGPYR